MSRSLLQQSARRALWAVLFLMVAAEATPQESRDSATNAMPWLPGLYRVVDTMPEATSSIRFLRLLPAGMGRVETVRIHDQAGRIVTTLSQEPLAKVWYSRESTSPKHPQLCLRFDGPARCLWIRREMPRGDLFLYDGDDELGSPSLVLRRAASRN